MSGDEKLSTHDLIRKYADILREIYDNRTAGDHTFEGVLANFIMEC